MDNKNYSPSVNIIRDKDLSLNYIVTPNAEQVAKSIASGFTSTGHCFNIIGSYGTGKSSFIWALEQNLNQKTEYFFHTGEYFNGAKNFEFINLIGSYSSLIESLAKQLNIDSSNGKDVLNALDKHYLKCKSEDKFLFIVIDEYGKFLEYSSKVDVEENIYFIQQLAEYVNDPKRNIILLTSLHQSFSQYGTGLNRKEQDEWQKVNGRFIHITFNEPIEQLLYLAGERIKQWKFEKNKLDEISSVNQAILDSKIIKNYANYDLEYASALYPMDLASANCLTRALQSYGQNERSLFTFLNRKEANSLYNFTKKSKWYSLSKVYDFLIQNFYGAIISSSNPDKNGWDAIRIALEKVEASFNKDIRLAEKLVKTIGLLSIFSSQGGKINHNLLLAYFFENDKKKVENILHQLEQKQIIRYREFSERFILFEGTDLDFDKAMLEASSKVTKSEDISRDIEKYYQLPVLLAKSISYTRGTPRFFAYKISNTPYLQQAKDELDGYINLIFSEQNLTDKINEASVNFPSNLYALFRRTEEIKTILWEIDKTEYVINENHEDRVACRELEKLKEKLENDLTKEVLNNLTSENVSWCRNGVNIVIESQRELNRELSSICEDVYFETPILRNELINRHKVSPAIATARRNYMRALIHHSDQEDLGFAANKYPAEKTIYLSLLKDTQIHQHFAEGKWEFETPDESGVFYGLWLKSMEILNRAKQEKINLQEFYNEFSVAPFKLKNGFLSFWIPTFLHIQQDNFALFNSKGYVPFLTEEVFELIQKNPKDYNIKTFSVEGIKLNLLNTYRTLINKNHEINGKRSVYIETIRPLFVFYRELPNYTKRTKNLPAEAILFREAIAKAQDPETAFFEDIPKALGYSGLDLKNENINLDDYTLQLKSVIKELRECEQNLIEQVEEKFKKVIGASNVSYKEYKNHLETRFDEIDIQIIPSHLKRLLQKFRLPSSKKSEWIKSIYNSLFNKNFSEIRDEEISIFITKFKKSFQQLERLVDIHKLNDTRKNESVYAVDIIDQTGEVKQERIIFPHEFSENYLKSENEVEKLIQKLQPEERKALLLKKLQELI
nr:P-loop NTPase fold protein [uncultured Marinifilum sp.]